MSSRYLLLPFFLALALCTTTRARAIDAQSRIARVTVHPDRAEVTRVAEVRLSAGESLVRFADLPTSIDLDSLRVSGRGASASIGAVELRQEVRAVMPSPELAVAQAEVLEIQLELARLTSEEATDLELRKYLQSLQESTARNAPLGSPATTTDTAALQRMFAFLREAHQDLGERTVKRHSARTALAEQIRIANARVQAATPVPSIQSMSVIVGVDVTAGGTLRLELSYVVPYVTWHPTYRALLDVDARKVELVSEAVITQQTGEDWNDVALTLSTAMPARDLESPELSSWILRVAPPVVARNDSSTSILEIHSTDLSLALTGDFINKIPRGANAEHGEMSTGIARIVNANLSEHGYHALFAVQGSSDVASGPAEHRVRLRTDLLKAEIEHRVVPSLDEQAYAVARCMTPADRPLLGGAVRVISNGAFLGTFELPEVGPATELEVPFGADPRIRVKHVDLPVAQSRESSRDQQMARASRTTIENLHDAPVIVTLAERLPVSTDERITVKVGQDTTPGASEPDDRPGIREWEMALAPKETRSVTLEYSVRFPKDVLVQGL